MYSTGKLHEVSIRQNVADIINGLVTNSPSDYALVFLGKKLQLDKKLEDIPHLNDSHTIKLLKQRQTTEKLESSMTTKEIEKLLADIKRMLKKLNAGNIDPTNQSHHKLMAYVDQTMLKKIIKEYPFLIAEDNLLSLDVIIDFRLLINMITENNKFLYDNPHCLIILKKALESVLESPTINNSRQSMHGNNSSHPSTSQIPSTSIPPLFTQQMLQQALAMTSTTANPDATEIQNSQESSSRMDIDANHNHKTHEYFRQKYSTQLEQMKDFGFNDEYKNVRALRLSSGNVEQALELVIESIDD